VSGRRSDVIKAALQEVWNPSGTAVSAGIEDERILLAPEANRLRMLTAHHITAEMLLTQRDTCVETIRRCDRLDTEFCVLRATVMWRMTLDSNGRPLSSESYRMATDLTSQVVACAPSDARGPYAVGADAYLAFDWSQQRLQPHEVLDAVAGFVASLDRDQVSGAALAACAMYASILQSDGRTRADLAAEQTALSIAFASSRVMSHDAGRIVTEQVSE